VEGRLFMVALLHRHEGHRRQSHRERGPAQARADVGGSQRDTLAAKSCRAWRSRISRSPSSASSTT